MVFSEATILYSLILATFLGVAVGTERSLSGKQAGMRTYALVSLGSCLFTSVGMLVSLQFEMFESINPLHLAGFVAIGIGFIGSGLSAMRPHGHTELTTAAGIWVAAAIGMSCGFRFYALAIGATIMTILIFSVFARLEHRIRVRFGKKLENEVE